MNIYYHFHLEFLVNQLDFMLFAYVAFCNLLLNKINSLLLIGLFVLFFHYCILYIRCVRRNRDLNLVIRSY